MHVRLSLLMVHVINIAKAEFSGKKEEKEKGKVHCFLGTPFSHFISHNFILSRHLATREAGNVLSFGTAMYPAETALLEKKTP